MKNFSAKNAEFETVTINNEAAITSADIGTAPNKIPLNKDLGSLAYQDAVNLDDVSADMVELRAIAAEVSDSAVDVFVYDTSRDSDGGAWRKRTQHTSWYNEELNTPTRGARREFPAVAVIVAETDKVTIYDGDDPDLGMWMMFNTTWAFGGNLRTCCAALNGKVIVGSSGWGVPQADFIKDIIDHQWNAGVRTPMGGGIINRNIDSRLSPDDSQKIVNSYVNDLAMTILPNAPIDDATGLPTPTIAVATDGGVSVIKDDGTVVDYTCTYNSNNKYSLINFIGDSKLLACSRDGETYPTVFDIPSQGKASFDSTDIVFTANPSDSSSAADISVGNYSEYKASAVTKEHIAMGGTSLIISNIDNVSGNQTADNVIISSSYNTGWMPGDIKLAALSDSVVENVGVSSDQLIVDGSGNWVGDFDVAGDLDSWTKAGDIDGITITGGKLRIERTTTLTSATYVMPVVEGVVYEVSADMHLVSGGGGPGLRLSKAQMTPGLSLVTSDLTSSNNTRNFRADYTGNLYISAYHGPAAGTSNFDNISVRATTELITNGDFSTDSDWTKGTGWTISGGVASCDGTDYAILTQEDVFYNFGIKYVLTFTVSSYTSGNVEARWYDGSWQTIGSEVNGLGTYSFTFTLGGGSNGDLTFRSGAFVGSIDNVSVRPAVDDRSVNNNGLQVIGEIDKTPVAPGADLVAYSGFSANNYLVQPYNSDLLDIDSYALIGWCKVGSTTTEQTFLTFKSGGENNYASSDTWTLMGCTSDGSLFIQTMQSNTSNFLKNGIVENTGSWHHFCFIVSNSELVIYKDGTLVDSEARTTSGSLYLSDSQLRIGARISPLNTRSPAHATSLSLIRLSKTIPTAAQIAKIYRDEKPLFQEDAQATLYGTSDATTALSYDEKTELLHVGTSAGRSDFSGLRRINNTTTAISTSISAHNNLIAEQ